MMVSNVSLSCLTMLILFVPSLFAADKVVVIPLGGTTAAGQHCPLGQHVTGFDSRGDIVCNYPTKYVFVTSTTYQGSIGGSGGIESADFQCQWRANVANLGGTYRAWLSDGSSNPMMRFIRNPGDYITPAGVVIANGWHDLTDGTLQNPINTTELGASYNGQIWTATRTMGFFFGSKDCVNWTSVEPAEIGAVGYSESTDSHWTEDTSVSCKIELPLYCVEQ